MKKCNKCENMLDENNFHKKSNSPDGLAYICKVCAKIKRRMHYEKNKEKSLSINRTWAKNNPEKNRSTRSRRAKYKYNTDPRHRMIHNLRKRVSTAIGRGQKTGSAITDLGCSIEELMTHLESKFDSNMNWENYGSYWHIDHIIPLSSFDLTNKIEFMKANHFTNLQPLEAKANLIKSDKVPTVII